MAAKIEKKDKKAPVGMLFKEATIITELQGFEGFPNLVEQSTKNEFKYIIMSFLGQNLESIKKKRECQKYSIQSVVMIAYQMITNLNNLHQVKYIHRDIKPENLVVGNEGSQHIIFLIDFGLSKKYIDNSKHIPHIENTGLIGTARYTSVNSHFGTE